MMNWLKKATQLSLSYIIFLASAFILLILSINSYRRIQHQKASADLVSHTYHVKFKLEDAFGSLRDGEAAQRGFLLTGDTLFLNRYYSSISNIPKSLSELNYLVSDNKEQQQNLNHFTKLIRYRIQRLNLLLDSAAYFSISKLNLYLKENRKISDQSRVFMQEMQVAEDVLLSERIRQKETEEKSASTFILIFSVFSLLSLVFSFIALVKETRRRTRSEINAELLEKKVNERTLQIQEIINKLNIQNAELEKRNAELSSFTYIASHDLKEPLRKISIFSDRILESEFENLSPKGKDRFERILNSVKKMHVLLDSLFTYAKTGRETNYKLTDLNKVAQQAIDTLQELIDEKEATIEIKDLPELYVIPEQMEQLFTNLISNSLKYIEKDVKPFVKIVAEKEETNGKETPGEFPCWQITFSDNGIGFDEKYKDKMFQIFQRLHNNKEYSGTGIGLAITKKVVENHCGSINAYSPSGDGAVFVIKLPEQPASVKDN
jgi:signal transduction histidine kinase